MLVARSRNGGHDLKIIIACMQELSEQVGSMHPRTKQVAACVRAEKLLEWWRGDRKPHLMTTPTTRNLMSFRQVSVQCSVLGFYKHSG